MTTLFFTLGCITLLPFAAAVVFRFVLPVLWTIKWFIIVPPVLFFGWAIWNMKSSDFTPQEQTQRAADAALRQQQYAELEKQQQDVADKDIRDHIKNALSQ